MVPPRKVKPLLSLFMYVLIIRYGPRRESLKRVKPF